MKLAIFDVDGTLLDNLQGEDRCYSGALRGGLGLTELNTEWDQYEHISDLGIAAEAFARAFGRQPSTEQLSTTIEYFVRLLEAAHARAPLRCTAGAAAMLRDLPRRGWAPAIATGAWRRAAAFKLTAARLPTVGLPIATAEDGPSRTAIVSAARRRAEHTHGGTFDRVVCVGDATWDVAAARELRLPFVGVATGERAERLSAAGATTTLADFVSLGAVVDALNDATVPVMLLR